MAKYKPVGQATFYRKEKEDSGGGWIIAVIALVVLVYWLS